MVLVTVILCFALFLVSGITHAYETEELVFFYISSPDDPSLMDVVVVNFIDHYHYGSVEPPDVGYFYGSGYELVVLGPAGEEIFRIPVIDLYGPVSYDSVMGASGMMIVDGDDVLFEQEFSFCDGDGTCEPCDLPGCAVSENVLTCADCASGGIDGYCDELPDGICDPDCEGERDFDCGKTCSEMEGDVCFGDEICYGGDVVSSIDSDSCCSGGTCFDLGEYVETSIEMQNQPSFTITRTGDTAAAAQSQGFLGDYCIDELGGKICEPDEGCDGEWVEYYQGAFCCVGRCDEIEEVVTEEFIAEVRNETSTPLSQEEIDSLYGQDYEDILDEWVEDEDVWSHPEEMGEMVEDRTSRHIEIEEDISDEQEAQEEDTVARKVREVLPEIPDQVRGANLPVIVGGVLVVILVVVIFIAIFGRSARKDLAASSDKVAREEGAASAVRPAREVSASGVSGTSLQGYIDSMVSKGFSYTQVRQHLIGRGYDSSLVDDGIRKDYEARKSALRGRQG